VVRANLKGVNTVRKRLRDGRVRYYYYHRGTGRPLRGTPGSPDFLHDYAMAEQSRVQVRKDTLAGLIRDFTSSSEFEKKAESTRKEYRRMLRNVETQFGDMPLAALEDPRVRRDFFAWQDEVARASGPREADNRLALVSTVLTWGVNRVRLSVNHVRGFNRLHSVDRSDKIWLPEHVDGFMRVAPIELQRALILALHTGQRQADLRKLAWSNYDGSSITFRQGKGGRRVHVPCTQALREMLDGMERTAAVILTTKTGLAWEKRYFAQQWDRAAKLAGITDLHFHDLRGTAITMLGEAGCTVPEIASITGHSFKSVETILEKYLARTKALAHSAMSKFENASSTSFANRLQTSHPGGVADEA
jgi:integrase